MLVDVFVLLNAFETRKIFSHAKFSQKFQHALKFVKLKIQQVQNFSYVSKFHTCRIFKFLMIFVRAEIFRCGNLSS